jgi:hypothetical protein
MGCIVLEFLIWLLYGNTMIEKLYAELRGSTQHDCQYFEFIEDGPGTKASVHRVAQQWMDHIQTHDPECKENSAIKDLLNLVRTKLLVVELPPRRKSAMGGGFSTLPTLALPDTDNDRRYYRATAEVLRDSLKGITDKFTNQHYLFSGKSRDHVRLPSIDSRKLLSTGDALKKETNMALKLANPESSLTANFNNVKITNDDYSLPPRDQWQFPVDEKFAAKVLSRLGVETFRPSSSFSATLCSQCEKYNFWRGGFSMEIRTGDLLERSQDCDFCQMLWDAHKRGGRLKSTRVRFERDESTLRISGDKSLPALLFLRSPGEHY